MALELIGAGFGRTGTMSIQAGLDRLGLGPCYHMAEVALHADQVELWMRAARSELASWDEIFGPYRATVDWPACAFWRDLTEAYPAAKVLLNVRDPQRWYESFSETILAHMAITGSDNPMLDRIQQVGAFVIGPRSFPEFPTDAADWIAAFERHNAAVIEAIPAERLLVYQVSEGWEPLCEFLGRPVPDEPFPNVNDRAAFRALFDLDG